METTTTAGTPFGGSATLDSPLGWIAEFRIPLSQLRYDPITDLGIAIERTIRAKERERFFVHAKDGPRGATDFGHLTGLGNFPQPRRLDWFLRAVQNENPGVDRNVRCGRGTGLFRVSARSEVREHQQLHPRRDLQSYFGQVEAIPRRESLRVRDVLPSGEPFFVEGASIFSVGGMRSNNTSGLQLSPYASYRP